MLGFSCDCDVSANEDWAFVGNCIENANENWASVLIGCQAWSSFGCQWRLGFWYDWVPSMVGLWLWFYWECQWKLGFVNSKENKTFFLDEDGSRDFGCQWRLGFGLERKLGVSMEIGLCEFQSESDSFFFFTFILGWEWELRFCVPMKIGLWT